MRTRCTAFHRRLVARLGVALLAGSSGCSVFELGSYESFKNWYAGPPGIMRAVQGKDHDAIEGDRPLLYGHFRIPELLFQPIGGWTYPPRTTVTNETLADAMAASASAQSEAQRNAETNGGYGVGHATYTSSTVHETGPENSLAFDWFDAGLVEAIPYRTYASDEGVGYKVGVTLMQPLNVCWMAVTDVVFRAPVFVVHDVLKTVMIPVAAVYYSGHGDEPADAAGSGELGPPTSNR